MNRALQVIRIQTFTGQNGLIWPWGILASAFAINLAIFSVIGEEIPGGPKTGGLASIYVTAVVVGVSLVQQFLPFLLGFGVTRRTFIAGTSALVALWSLGTAVGLYLLALVERATDGWGIRLPFFDLPFLAENPIIHILEYAATMASMVCIGGLLGAVGLRWGVNGIMVLMVASIVVLGGLSVLITSQGWWGDLFDFIVDQPTSMLLTVWPGALAAATAAATYLAIRRIPA